VAGFSSHPSFATIQMIGDAILPKILI